MKVIKSKGFKYFKNFVIGIGASIVMLGALFKIMSWEYGDEMITAGLVTEAILFAMLGILPPESDYYWEKLYPGLNDYNAKLSPITAGPQSGGPAALDGERVDKQLDGMLTELQTMARSMTSLKALQEVDFKGTSEQIKKMSTFYSSLNEAMANVNDSVKDTQVYKENLKSLNTNLSSINNTYSTMLKATGGVTEAMGSIAESAQDAKNYKAQLAKLNQNLSSLNNVYGNILGAMGGRPAN